MNAIKKVLMFAILAVVCLAGAVSASPISVSDVNIQEVKGEYIVLVTLANTNVATGIYDDLSFKIEEFGTTKSVGPQTVDVSSKTVSFNLNQIVESYSSLKSGNTYTLVASTSTGSKAVSFLFGSEKTNTGLDLVIDSVKVNGEVVTTADKLNVINGETLTVDLRFKALADFDDARLMFFIEGYEHSPLVGTTPIFAVKESVTYSKIISLALPADMDSQREYKLRIVGANDLSGITYKEYSLYVDTQRHRVDIIDMVMTPSTGVEPGQNIIANVRFKNRGQKSQDSVKVMISVPALGVHESSYVSNLDNKEVITSDDMLLMVPDTAKAGQYEVLVQLAYNDGYTTSVESFNMNIIAPREVPEKNLMVSFRDNINLKAGKETSFEIVVANPNTASKAISISGMQETWIEDLVVSPSLAMVSGGDSVVFKVTITPKQDIAGEKELNLVIKEGSSKISDVTVKTYVEASSSMSWVDILLIVLLIIAVIVLLSLLFTFAKKRKTEKEDEDLTSTEEYY